eukprot:14924460-Ditylum_brightwellii.AAC.1
MELGSANGAELGSDDGWWVGTDGVGAEVGGRVGKDIHPALRVQVQSAIMHMINSSFFAQGSTASCLVGVDVCAKIIISSPCSSLLA